MTNRFPRRAIARALLTTSALVATPAFAADYVPPPIPPIRETIDQNGVDLTRGVLVGRTHTVSIGGAGAAGMSWSRTILSGGSHRDSTAIVLSVSGSSYTLSNGASSESFTLTGGDYVSDQKTGSTLSVNGTTYTYTTRDGTVYKLDPWSGQKQQYGGSYRVSTITYPTGEVLTFNWDSVSVCVWIPKLLQCGEGSGIRLDNVTSTNGYKLQFTFVAEDPVVGESPDPNWAIISTVQAQNMSVDPASQSWPTLTLNGDSSVTDSLNRATTYTFTTPGLTAIKRPGASSNNETISYTSGKVSQVFKDGVTTNYSYSTVGSVLTTTVTDANSHTRVVNTDTTTGLVSSDTDELGKTTSYTYYSGSGLLNTVTAPEGNSVSFVYDGRGNLTQTTLTPKSGSGLSPIVTSASYPASDPTKTWLCASGTPVVTCNKPTTTTDAKGNVTNYAWDSTTGLPTSVTKPAPTTGAVRPQTRYSYSSVYGQYLSGGSLVNFATPVTRLTGISQCQTNASCSGTSDEVKGTITYGTANALPISISNGAGDGSLTATSAFTYDTIGNKLTVDGPLSGTADTTRTRYDADREVIGVVDPDPDGAGSLKMRAKRITYNADAQVTKTQLGTVLSQSDADWANFSSSQEVDTSYDSNARPVTHSLVSGGTTYALTQNNYDSLGRLNCSAVRMNPAIYGSLPSDPCTLGTQGSYGPDQITKIGYDADSRPISATLAYGTTDQAVERTLAYSDNGKVISLTDGENNKTTYVYDGVDRLSQTQYPSATKGSGTSNSGDYEQLTYDANSNVTQRRVRSGATISLSYDNLNRMTHKGGSSIADRDFTYDNLDRMLTAKFSTGGQGITNAYDALSRVTSRSSDMGGTAHALTYQYDLSGNRTQMNWWDGFYINYDRLVTGELSKVREDGASSGVGVLATYGYDDLRRRTALTFGNGASQAISYDPVSRLSQLTNDLSGTTNDLTASFAYSPASQIASTTRTGDAYAYTGNADTNTGYTSNGLNQQVSIGGSTAAWDSNGNLTSEPQSAITYTYDAENKLSSETGSPLGSATLSYDPLNRLDTYNPTPLRRFVYDGNEAVAELDSSGVIQNRYVRGDGADELLVDYSGSGTSSRRFTSADERGSIISLTDSSGNVIGIDRYDEYGRPQSSNIGRFGYTGQAWLAEANINYYKARDYLPQLGIFAQSDPASPASGPNSYSYVANEPVKGTDPTGMFRYVAESQHPGSSGGLGFASFSTPDPNQNESSPKDSVSSVTPPNATAILPGYKPPATGPEVILEITDDLTELTSEIVSAALSDGTDVLGDVAILGDAAKLAIDAWGPLTNDTPDWIYAIANVPTPNDWVLLPSSIYVDTNSQGFVVNYHPDLNQIYGPNAFGPNCPCQIDNNGPNKEVEIEFR